MKALVLQRSKGAAYRIPVPGDVDVFAKDDGVVYAKNEWGIENTMQPDGLYTRPQMLVADAGVTPAAGSGRTAMGIVLPTASATTFANGDDANAAWHDHATSTTLNNAVGLISAAFNLFRPGWYPRMRMLVKTPATLTSLRYMHGFFSASPDGASLPTTLHGAYFRYDTTTDGTAFWRTCTAAGGSPTVTTTTQAIAASTVYLLGIDMVPPDPFSFGQTPPRVVFTIATALTEGVVAAHTATLPAANQALGWGMRVQTLTTAARSLIWSRVGWSSP